jgi:hypothetical protein
VLDRVRASTVSATARGLARHVLGGQRIIGPLPALDDPEASRPSRNLYRRSGRAPSAPALAQRDRPGIEPREQPELACRADEIERLLGVNQQAEQRASVHDPRVPAALVHEAVDPPR